MSDSTNSTDVQMDWSRGARTGVPEVVFGESKSIAQLIGITRQCLADNRSLFFTRISDEKAQRLCKEFGMGVFPHAESATLYVGDRSLDSARTQQLSESTVRVGIVAAGSSDAPLVAEIEQCLLYLGQRSQCFIDVGVAGLWRLIELAPELREFDVLLAVAGMEGALFSVLAGLVKAPVIAVPSSVGYGVAKGGHVALQSALASCAPGLAVVNIDNGFGAAALAVKMLQIPESISSAGNITL